MRALVHLERFVPDSDGLAGVAMDGHDARLVQYNPFAFDVNQRVGRTQVDGYVRGEVE
jgi:hypothetical protein